MPQALLKPLRKSLVSQGLPADYISRTLDELNDHLVDADSPDAMARLGEPRRLAKRFAREYRSSTFVGRHPVVSFVLLAVVLLQVVFTLYHLIALFSVVAVAMLNGINVFAEDSLQMGELSPTLRAVLIVLFACGSFVPFAVVSWLASGFVKRIGRGPKWAVGVFAVLALLASTCLANVHVAETFGEKSSLTLSQSFPPPVTASASLVVLSRPLLQALVVVTCGWMFCHRLYDDRLLELAE